MKARFPAALLSILFSVGALAQEPPLKTGVDGTFAPHAMPSLKGGVEGWHAKVVPGRVLYEMEGITEETAREAFRLAGHKLPVATRFVSRSEQL